MNRISLVIFLSLIISCSSSSNDEDLLYDNTTNTVGENNESNSSSGNDQNSDPTDDNSNNNNSNESSEDNNDQGDNTQDQENLNPILFDKWNFGDYSNKLGDTKNDLNFLILRSNNQYIININGVETRGVFSSIGNSINLNGFGLIRVESFNNQKFNFEIESNNGSLQSIKSLNDTNYNDGDCVSFLECVDQKTFSVLSRGTYSFLKQIFNDEFFLIYFEDNEDFWISVFNNRKIIKLMSYIYENEPSLFDLTSLDLDFSEISYRDAILNIDHGFNTNCENDWSVWRNYNNIYYHSGFDPQSELSGQAIIYDSYSTLHENSFRGLKFSLNDWLGRHLQSFQLYYNLDETITVEFSSFERSQVDKIRISFREIDVDYEQLSGGFCLYNDETNNFLSDTTIGGIDVDGLDSFYYNPFTFWTWLYCEYELCYSSDTLNGY